MYQIISSSFQSHDCLLDARLYLPESNQKLPIIIMAHGFGARMDFGLHPFADVFANIGFAVLMFDYRGFGKSKGSLRQLVYHKYHIEDYHSAIHYVKTMPNIDIAKIVLWGTSYSGGHVLTVASQDTTIAGVIAQVPFVDGIATAFHLPIKNIIIGMYSGIRDMLTQIVNSKPYTIPVVSLPDSFAAMNTADSYQGYMNLVPAEVTDENWCPARVCLTLPLYRPTTYVKNIMCPVCIIAAEYDSLIPLSAVKKAEGNIKNIDFHILPCGHFEPYKGTMFEKSIAIQKRFLERLL
jgi:pimeloyl-ACP methyl ester carboxylesterase